MNASSSTAALLVLAALAAGGFAAGCADLEGLGAKSRYTFGDEADAGPEPLRDAGADATPSGDGGAPSQPCVFGGTNFGECSMD